MDDCHSQSLHLLFQSHPSIPVTHAYSPSVPSLNIPQKNTLVCARLTCERSCDILKMGAYLTLQNWTFALVITDLSWLWFLQLVKYGSWIITGMAKKCFIYKCLVMAIQCHDEMVLKLYLDPERRVSALISKTSLRQEQERTSLVVPELDYPVGSFQL